MKTVRLTCAKSSAPRAFTLIELLVVITIIAILAGISVPAYTGIITSGKQVKAMNDARQVALAMRVYAGDNEGAFPNGHNAYGEEILTSNDAYRSLIPAYLESELVFAVASSPVGPTADNRIETPSVILTRGENHWAYVSGLSSTSNTAWPLIVDHTDGSGFYTNRETEPGGTWKGAKAVVIHTDASARIVKLSGTGIKRFIPRFNDAKKNALELRDYMGEGAKLLEPAR